MINFDPIDKMLFVGSCPTSLVDINRLANMLRVSAVMSLQSDADLRSHGISWPSMEQAYKDRDIVVARYPIRDFDPIDLEARLNESVEALNELLASNHKVYVHCNAGICRAPATVIGYLHRFRGLELDDALKHVRDVRPMVNPYMDAVRAALKPEESNLDAG
jgi:predicted protein tyrosine phosphatase